MKSGFVAILGKPNVGKSTLINAIIKEKVSIVSPKPQTTRDKILGILNEDDYQIIFIDTPGIHSSHNKLDMYMDKSIQQAQAGVDVILLMFDATKGIRQSDIDTINSYKNSNAKVIVLINKVDKTSYDKLYPDLAKLNDIKFVEDIIPLSAMTNRNVDIVVNKIKELLPEGVRYFDEDKYTDKSLRFMIAETIREKTLWLLQDEIPHGIAVEVVNFIEDNKKVLIDADIILEKKSHKMIVIGKNGEMLKEIGTRARLDIEKLLGKKIFLNIFVKVKEDWRNNNYYIGDLGYKNTDNND